MDCAYYYLPNYDITISRFNCWKVIKRSELFLTFWTTSKKVVVIFTLHADISIQRAADPDRWTKREGRGGQLFFAYPAGFSFFSYFFFFFQN